MNSNNIPDEGRGQSLRSLKNEYREKYRKARANLSSEEKALLESKIASAFTSTMVYKCSSQILLYASMDDEISTWEIAKKALADGKKLLYPKCEGEHEMSFYYASSIEELKSGMFGIPEPTGGEVYRPNNGDVCIVPGLAYDKYGYRLGYGRGFYDRFLSGFSGVTVGLCYSSFIDSCLPRGKYDVKTDVVLTEKGVFPLQKTK